MRSVLFVPVDDATGLVACLESQADALILDLYGSEAADDARRRVRDILDAAQERADRPLIYVRIGGLDGPRIDADLSAVLPGDPDGLVLAECGSGRDVQHLAAKLAVIEAELDLAEGSTGIIAEAGTTARSLFALGSYGDASPRLIGLAWNDGLLAADLGLADAQVAAVAGSPLVTARALVLFAARAADVAAIDAGQVHCDPDMLSTACEAARRDGFNAKIAFRSTDVPIINAVFDRAF